MIVKVKNSEDTWSYFECDIIHSKFGFLKDIETKGNYVVLLESKDVSKNKYVKMLNLETRQTHLRSILTDRVVYVLNGEGKTIDRI